jgi:hypothetical protein
VRVEAVGRSRTLARAPRDMPITGLKVPRSVCRKTTAPPVPTRDYPYRLARTESSVDDLCTCRGVVLSRAATILRSIETQPLTGRFVLRSSERQNTQLSLCVSSQGSGFFLSVVVCACVCVCVYVVRGLASFAVCCVVRV